MIATSSPSAVRSPPCALHPEAVALLRRLSFPLPTTSSASPPTVRLDSLSLLDLLLHCNSMHALSFWVLRSLAKELRQASSPPSASSDVAAPETITLCEALQHAQETLDRQLTARVLAPVLLACLTFYVDATAYDHAALRRDVRALLTTGGGGQARYCRDDVDDADAHAESLWETEADEGGDAATQQAHDISKLLEEDWLQRRSGASDEVEEAPSGPGDGLAPPPAAPSPHSAATRRRWHRERCRTATAAPPQTDVGVLLLRLCAALHSSSATHRTSTAQCSGAGETLAPPPWLSPPPTCPAPSSLSRDEVDADAERRWCALAWHPRVVAALLRRGGACLADPHVPHLPSASSPSSRSLSGLPAHVGRGSGHRDGTSHSSGRGVAGGDGVVVTLAACTSLAPTRGGIRSGVSGWRHSSSSSSAPATMRRLQGTRGPWWGHDPHTASPVVSAEEPVPCAAAQPKHQRARDGGGARIGEAPPTLAHRTSPSETTPCAGARRPAATNASVGPASAAASCAAPHWSDAAHLEWNGAVCSSGVAAAHRADSHILSLPTELQRHCLEYVTPRYVRTVSTVCSGWYALVRDGDPSSSTLRRALHASTAVTHVYTRFFTHEWGEQAMPVALLTPLHRLRLALQVLPGGATAAAQLQLHWQRARRDADVCLYTREHCRRSEWGLLAGVDGRHEEADAANLLPCTGRDCRTPCSPWQGDRRPLSVALYVYYVLRIWPTLTTSASSAALPREGIDVRATLLTVLQGFATEFKWVDVWATDAAGVGSRLQRESVRQQRLVWWLLACPSATSGAATAAAPASSAALAPRNSTTGAPVEAEDLLAQLLAHWPEVREVWLWCRARGDAGRR